MVFVNSSSAVSRGESGQRGQGDRSSGRRRKEDSSGQQAQGDSVGQSDGQRNESSPLAVTLFEPPAAVADGLVPVRQIVLECDVKGPAGCFIDATGARVCVIDEQPYSRATFPPGWPSFACGSLGTNFLEPHARQSGAQSFGMPCQELRARRLGRCSYWLVLSLLVLAGGMALVLAPLHADRCARGRGAAQSDAMH
jgi:hypothetical protein